MATSNEAFTVRECSGWCVEVTFPSTPPGAIATHLVVNTGDNETLARQIAHDCNIAVYAGRLDTERFSYLSDREQEALAEMMSRQDMTPEAVMRHALRMHQFVDHYLRQGMEICFRTKDSVIIRPFHSSKLAPMPVCTEPNCAIPKMYGEHIHVQGTGAINGEDNKS